MAEFWFGNLTKAGYHPAPSSGMDADSVGFSDRLDFQNGGAYVAQTQGTHREFNLSWGVQEKSAMQWLSDYRNGVNGTGLLYMVDPFATNALPPHWATPSLTCGDWPSLVSPSVQPTQTGAATVTNLYERPSFETRSSLKQTVRTNLAVNPNGVVTGGAGLQPNNSTNNSIARVAVPSPHPLGITTAYRGSATLTTDPNGMNAYNPDGLGDTAIVRRVGGWFFCAAAYFTVEIRGQNAAITTGKVDLPQNVWTWVEMPTATASHITVIVQRTSGTNGNAVYATGFVSMELAAGIKMPQRLDGDMANTDEWEYAWSGAVANSASIQQGYQISGVAPSYDQGSYVVSATEWAGSGSRSARIVPRSSNSYWFLSTSGLLTVGKTYTVSITTYQPSVQTGGLSAEARQLQYREGATRVAVAQSPNIPGVDRLSITFTPTMAGLLLLMNGSANEDLLFDEVSITETPTQYPYFDGDTRFIDGSSAAWVGTAHASKSTANLTPMGMPNFGAAYRMNGEINAIPQRMLTLLIPSDRDLWLGFSGSIVGGAALRMRPITRDGRYGSTSDLTMLDPTGVTRLNTRVSGRQYSAVQVYLTTTAIGGGTVTLVSGKAAYTANSETLDLTGSHSTGDGHTGFVIDDVTTAYIQAANGHQYVTTATKATEIEAWI